MARRRVDAGDAIRRLAAARPEARRMLRHVTRPQPAASSPEPDATPPEPPTEPAATAAAAANPAQSDARASLAPSQPTDDSRAVRGRNGAQSAPDAPQRGGRRAATSSGQGDDEWRVAQTVAVPDDLLAHMRAILRPPRTGANRSIGARLLLEATIEAVWLDLRISPDVWGLRTGDRRLARQRVREAIEARFAGR